MATITFRPLAQWPSGRARTSSFARQRSQFDSPHSATMDMLDRELSMILARNIVLQIDVAGDRELRRDGEVRHDARVNSPAVVLSFTRKDAPLVFATDYFNDWRDNVRAIAMGLEGLRRLERYHIGQSGDQYRGWQALPSSTTTALSASTAAEVLARRTTNISAAAILRDVDTARSAYRAAAAATHPDAGGTTADFQLVQEARRVLEALFGAPL